MGFRSVSGAFSDDVGFFVGTSTLKKECFVWVRWYLSEIHNYQTRGDLWLVLADIFGPEWLNNG